MCVLLVCVCAPGVWAEVMMCRPVVPPGGLSYLLLSAGYPVLHGGVNTQRCEGVSHGEQSVVSARILAWLVL